MRENEVVVKSTAFAKRIIRVYQYLCKQKKEFDLSRQLLRAGTSIGANVREAQYGISKKDFLSKLYIALKETAETLYWLELLASGQYLSKAEYQSLYDDCEQLRKMLSSITKTIRENSEIHS